MALISEDVASLARMIIYQTALRTMEISEIVDALKWKVALSRHVLGLYRCGA
jgi:hypothetical protein